jgi:hypothetical protein
MVTGIRPFGEPMWNIFVDAVSRHFNFLEARFQFVRTQTKPPFIVFESPLIRVEIYYDAHGTGELDLGISRRHAPSTDLSIGISTLLRLHEGVDSLGYTSPYPETPEVLEAEVRRLADLLQEHGSQLLGGDLRDFERVRLLEAELAKRYARD